MEFLFGLQYTVRTMHINVGRVERANSWTSCFESNPPPLKTPRRCSEHPELRFKARCNRVVLIYLAVLVSQS